MPWKPSCPTSCPLPRKGSNLLRCAARWILAPWQMENDPDTIARQIGLGEVGNELSDLLKPERLLDILRNFSLFSQARVGRIKVIPRFQYEGANKIVGG